MTGLDRRSLEQRLAYLALEARKLPDEALGEALKLQLEKAARDAELLADEMRILRAQAADRERSRALVQVVAAEVDRFDPLLGGAELVLAVIRDVLKRAASTDSKDTNPKEFQP